MCSGGERGPPRGARSPGRPGRCTCMAARRTWPGALDPALDASLRQPEPVRVDRAVRLGRVRRRETAELADVVLPVASPFEREGLKIGFEVSPAAQTWCNCGGAWWSPAVRLARTRRSCSTWPAISASAPASGTVTSRRPSATSSARRGCRWRRSARTRAADAVRSLARRAARSPVGPAPSTRSLASLRPLRALRRGLSALRSRGGRGDLRGQTRPG